MCSCAARTGRTRRWVAAAGFAITTGVGAPGSADAQWTPPNSPAIAGSARALLDGFVDEAIRGNLGLAAQRQGALRAEGGVREARGRFLPTVGVNARYSEFTGVINIGDFINPAYAALNGLIGSPRFPTNVNATLPFRQETKLELVQPLFVPALRAASAAAGAQRDIADATVASTARRVAADIQLAWLGFASSERVVETLESARAVVDENVRASERLVRAGQATPDVVLRARAESSDMQQQLAEAKRQRDAARRGFNLLRNRDPETPVALAADSSLLPPDTLALDALETHALAHREELQQADGGIRLSDAARRSAATAFLPTVSLAASYGVQGERYRFDRQSDVGLASLVLSWNVFNGGQDVARRQQADLTRDQATTRRREAERMVQTDVRNAFDGVASARTATRAAADRLVSAERAFSLVERRYAEGLTNHVEFLSARSAFTAAALNDVITRYTLAARAVELERAAALRRLPE
ncbi:MAG TPA: TolC family protein [Gemmatimonas sp.]|nr:TolC family protein [Gemmatimonas sp.]